MKLYQYAVLLTAAEEGGFVVTSRDIPHLVTQGEDVRDALAEATDAMDEVFATYMKKNLPFPEASELRDGEHWVRPPVETVAKAALYDSMRARGTSKSDLARQLGLDEKEVRRMLDPHYPSKLPRLAEAVSLLGNRLVMGMEEETA